MHNRPHRAQSFLDPKKFVYSSNVFPRNNEPWKQLVSIQPVPPANSLEKPLYTWLYSGGSYPMVPKSRFLVERIHYCQENRTIGTSYLNLVNWYLTEIFCFSASVNELKYFFQPGQKFICHRHSLPINDLGFLSNFARIGQFSQFVWFAIDLNIQLIQFCFLYIINPAPWAVIITFLLIVRESTRH